MITKQDIESIGNWTHRSTYSNGGTKTFVFGDGKTLPVYTLKYNGDNFIYKQDNDVRLNEIKIKVLKSFEKIDGDWKSEEETLYEGKPKNLEELKNELKN